MNRPARVIRWFAILWLMLSACALPPASLAIELFEEDSMGNINQRNVGSYKSKRFGSQNSGGPVVQRSRPLGLYSTLKLEMPVELEYFDGGNARVEIMADQETINTIQFVYSGDRLTIKSNGFATSSPVKLLLYGNDLQRVFINSAADVTLNDINVVDFLLSVRGSADVAVNGGALDCQINAQGATDLDLSKMKCQDVTLLAQGSADIVISASKSLKGRVQGSGDVEVYGNPARRKLQVMGAYDVHYE